MDDDVAVLRAFNRAFTQRIGVLDDRFLGRGRPVGESRLLFDIGPSGAPVASLRRRLGLDSGYVSRMLRRLETQGLVEVTPDPQDRRRRVARLTTAGRREWTELDVRSDRLARELLAALGDRDRRTLNSALRSAERLVRAATVTFDVEDPGSPDAAATLHRYREELQDRFGVPVHLPDAASPALRPPSGALVVVHDGGEPVACGGLQTLCPQVVELKRMWVDTAWRGVGLGRRLLDDLEARARDMGATHVRLDTHDALTEAITMYERSGYRRVPRYNDNPQATRWYEKTLGG